MAIGVKFWGVRGSIACPSPKHVKYGGNTSCVELKLGDNYLILDAGTGIRDLGNEILKRGTKHCVLLLTHTHWDHINGFPFFAPAYIASNSMKIMAGHLTEKGGIERILSTQMSNPVFPVPLDAMKASLEFEDFTAGDSFTLFGDVKVKTTKLNHPNGATGYRIEYDGKSVCYITDTEHTPDKKDENILKLIEGADLVIYDSTYTEEEFAQKIGWGHSTWNEGVALCRAANVKKMALFHHGPEHEDQFMARIEKEAYKEWNQTFAARDNMKIII